MSSCRQKFSTHVEFLSSVKKTREENVFSVNFFFFHTLCLLLQISSNFWQEEKHKEWLFVWCFCSIFLVLYCWSCYICTTTWLTRLWLWAKWCVRCQEDNFEKNLVLPVQEISVWKSREIEITNDPKKMSLISKKSQGIQESVQKKRSSDFEDVSLRLEW